MKRIPETKPFTPPVERKAPGVGTPRARKLRYNASMPERQLWNILRQGREKGLPFRRQHPVGPYIADFYCHQAALIVELDGQQHVRQKAYDAARDEWMAARGVDDSAVFGE